MRIILAIASDSNRKSIELWLPYPPGMSGSPPPPDCENNPLVGSPLEAAKARPSAPVTLGEATRDRVEIPAAHGRVVTTAGSMGTATRVTGIRTGSCLLPFRLLSRRNLQMFQIGTMLELLGRQVTIHLRSLVDND